jgi:hypothetical protein
VYTGSPLFILGAFLWAACALSLCARNPDDIDFTLRLMNGSAVYHMGEPVAFEISYSSRTEKKYRGSWTNPSPYLDVVTLHLSPTAGTFDLRRLHPNGFFGSILSGNGYLGRDPVIQKADLADWFRFEKPGHYSLSVASLQVSRMKSADEGGGEEQITLESNAVEFDILPHDPAWESQELWSILQALDTGSDAAIRSDTRRRLVLLDTPAAVQTLVQMYRSTPETEGDSYTLCTALRESSHAKLIVPALEAALTDPAAQPPSSLPELLADLQVRNELGDPTAQPENPTGQQQWQADYQERSKAHERYFAHANEMVLAGIRRRTGPQRALAIYQAWSNAERQNGNQPGVPEMLAKLRVDVLAAATDLQPAQQAPFLSLAWDILPHEQLLPVIKQLSHRDIAASYRIEALRLWCEGWPDDCAAGVIADVIKPESEIPPHIILLMPEAEHTELDPVLEARLAAPAMHQNFQHAVQTAALILRAGSRNLHSIVEALLDQNAENRKYACEVEGFLLGYLLRVGSGHAEKHLTAELNDKTDACGSQLLRTLNNARYSDSLIPIALNALTSPNFAAAGNAALLLGDRGPARSRMRYGGGWMNCATYGAIARWNYGLRHSKMASSSRLPISSYPWCLRLPMPGIGPLHPRHRIVYAPVASLSNARPWPREP